MTVYVCREKDAACAEFLASERCANCPTLPKTTTPPSPVGGEVTDALYGLFRRASKGMAFSSELDELLSSIHYNRAATPTKPDAKDPERLDWLEAFDPAGMYYNLDAISALTHQRLFWPANSDRGFSSLREAIDHAIASTKPSEGKP